MLYFELGETPNKVCYMSHSAPVSPGKSAEFSSGQHLQPSPESMPTSPQIETQQKPRAQVVQDLKNAATRYKEAQLNSFTRLLAKTGVIFQDALHSENMAKEHLKTALSDFLNAIQVKVDVDTLISTEKSVEHIYQIATESEVVAGIEILENSLKSLAGKYGRAPPSKLYESIEELLKKAQDHKKNVETKFYAKDVTGGRKELEKANKALKQAQAKFDKMEKEQSDRKKLDGEYVELHKRFSKYKGVKSTFLTNASASLTEAFNLIQNNGSLDKIKNALSNAQDDLFSYEKEAVAKASASRKRQR